MPNYHVPAIALIALALFPCPLPTHAKATHKSKATIPKADPNYTFIKQAYDYQSSGFPKRDINIIMSYRAADFVCITTEGSVETRNHYMKRAYQTFLQSQYINPVVTRTITIQKATFTTYTATIEESTGFTVTAQSPADFNKTISTTIPLIYYLDTWTRTAIGWIEQKSVHL